MRNRVRRPKGLIRMWRNDVLLFEVENLVVDAGLPAFAHSSAGDTAYKVAVIGFGSGNTAPSITDTDMSGTQKYYNAVGNTPTYPSSGTVQYTFNIQSSDYAATGLSIQELGMYANSNSLAIPSLLGFGFSAWSGNSSQPVGNLVTDGSGHVFRSTTPGSWAAGQTIAIGYTIIDSNGNLQQVTTGGTTKGSPHPTWATTPVGATTTDNSVTWTLRAIGLYSPTTGGSTPSWVTTTVGSSLTVDGNTLPVVWTYVANSGAPTPMIAHATVPTFAFTGAASYSGSWSLTF